MTNFLARAVSRYLRKNWPTLHARLRKAAGINAMHRHRWEQDRDLRRIQGVVRHAVRARTEVSFVGIGANDGASFGDVLHDLVIHDTRWTGVLVEPIPFLFEQLRENWKGVNRVACANVAIGTAREIRPFYYVSRDAERVLGKDMRRWYLNLGSFNKNHVLKHEVGGMAEGIRKLRPFIVEEGLQCVPLQGLLDDHAVTRLDVVVIDTEGFDYEVLKQLDVQRYRPVIVLWEYMHLTDADRASAEQMFRSAGYTVESFQKDTIARLPEQA